MNWDRFAAAGAVKEQAGLSQKALAEEAGLVTHAIGHLEQGLRKPTWETVLALAPALGVSCSAFENDRRPGTGRDAEAEGKTKEERRTGRDAPRERRSGSNENHYGKKKGTQAMASTYYSDGREPSSSLTWTPSEKASVWRRSQADGGINQAGGGAVERQNHEHAG